MIIILEKPVRFLGDDEEDNRDDLVEDYHQIASGETYEDCLENLIIAINEGEVDDINNELIIVKHETNSV